MVGYLTQYQWFTCDWKNKALPKVTFPLVGLIDWSISHMRQS